MSHHRAMVHIRQAAWPLVLKFRLPLDERDVFSLEKLAEMRYPAARVTRSSQGCASAFSKRFF